MESMQSTNSIYMISQASCQSYQSTLHILNPPPLNEFFVKAVEDLSQSEGSADEEEKYYEFFKDFGTHYPTKMDFGARYINKHKINRQAYRKLQDSSLSVSAQASYEGIVSVSGSASATTSQKSAVDNFKEMVETETITMGSLPSGDMGSWAASIKSTAVPIKYKLESIENLFTATFFKSRSALAAAVRAKIIEYKPKYLQSLLTNGDIKRIEDPDYCKSTPEDSQYSGDLDRTREGYKCAGGTKCRNSDGKSYGPFCVTSDPSVKWGYCNVPPCDNSPIEYEITVKVGCDGNDGSPEKLLNSKITGHLGECSIDRAASSWTFNDGSEHTSTVVCTRPVGEITEITLGLDGGNTLWLSDVTILNRQTGQDYLFEIFDYVTSSKKSWTATGYCQSR